MLRTNTKKLILPDSPSVSPPPPEHPEFIEGSSSGNAHAPDIDTLNLAKRLQASASFNDDEDNIWNRSCSDQWAF